MVKSDGNGVKDSKYNVSNLERGLDIMELLLAHPDGLGISDISRILGVPKNGVFRIANTLAEREYLIRDENSKQFKLSKRLLSMGYHSANRSGLLENALPIMRSLRDEVLETVVMCVMAENHGVVLEQVPSLHQFRFVVDTGLRFHLHSSAPGKAIMAFLPDHELDLLMDGLELKKFTNTTITSRAGMIEELQRIRETGYALDRSEEIEGVHCVAAPVMDDKSYPIAALNVTGPSYRFHGETLNRAALLVKEAAMAISIKLGYQNR